MLISCDYGHHSMKVLSEEDKFVYMPSVVSSDIKEKEILTLNNNYNELENLRIRREGEFGKQEFLVGELARQGSKLVHQNNYDNDFKNETTKVLVETALALLIKDSDEEEIDLLLTLPISAYHNHKEDFKQAFLNKEINIDLYDYAEQEYNTIKFKINNVIVKQQGFTAYIDEILNSNGNIKEEKEEFIEGLASVIDIGFYSTDDYLIENLNPRMTSSVKIEGISNAYTSIQEKIKKEYDISKKLHELEEVVRNKELKIRGNIYDIENLVMQEFKTTSEYIYQELMNKNSNFINDVDNFILTGGGSLHLKEFLHGKLQNVILQDNPVKANAMGGLKWLKRQNN